jgi:site-specific recombinase XerD
MLFPSSRQQPNRVYPHYNYYVDEFIRTTANVAIGYFHIIINYRETGIIYILIVERSWDKYMKGSIGWSDQRVIPDSFVRAETQFRLARGATGYKASTLATYTSAWRKLGRYLVEQKLPTDIKLVKKQHIDGFLNEMRSATSAKTKRPYTDGTINNTFRGLQGMFCWALEDGVLKRSPLVGVQTPLLSDVPVPVLSDAQVGAMLNVCKGKGFLNVRDTALLWLMYDTGLRLAETVSIQLSDIDWDQQTVTVLGKGKKERTVPFGDCAADALKKYISSVRAKHRLHYVHDLWLGREKVLTRNGAYQIIRDVGAAAKINGMHPHILRHTFIHNCLSDGMSEGHVMELTGIKSRSMMDRYARSTRTARAIADHRRLSPGDRLGSKLARGNME